MSCLLQQSRGICPVYFSSQALYVLSTSAIKRYMSCLLQRSRAMCPATSAITRYMSWLLQRSRSMCRVYFSNHALYVLYTSSVTRYISCLFTNKKAMLLHLVSTFLRHSAFILIVVFVPFILPFTTNILLYCLALCAVFILTKAYMKTELPHHKMCFIHWTQTLRAEGGGKGAFPAVTLWSLMLSNLSSLS